MVRSWAPKQVALFDTRVFLQNHSGQAAAVRAGNISRTSRRGCVSPAPCFAVNRRQNKQIICITDGEPTAHIEGREIVLIYPPSEKTARSTLEEVHACTQAGIRLSTFALVEDYFYLGLKNFVDRMARLSRGVAAYCTAGGAGRVCVGEFRAGPPYAQECELIGGISVHSLLARQARIMMMKVETA